jgi:hypothetical protein
MVERDRTTDEQRGQGREGAQDAPGKDDRDAVGARAEPVPGRPEWQRRVGFGSARAEPDLQDGGDGRIASTAARTESWSPGPPDSQST